MDLSKYISNIAENFDLSDSDMQSVLRVGEGEYLLWKKSHTHIPVSEHRRLDDLDTIGNLWKDANYNVFNSKIKNELFAKISVFYLLCQPVVDGHQVLFMGKALLLDSVTPSKVSNTTLEYMEEALRSFIANCPNSVTSGEMDPSDLWVENIVQCTDEPGKLFLYMVYVLMGNPRTIYLEALMKGISQLYPNEHPDIIPAILMAALHPNYRIQDWVIQCADGQRCPELAIMLENIKPNADYVERYRVMVLEQYKPKVTEK
jgi:hypothetical protein